MGEPLTPNPFNDSQMATLAARVPLERLGACLTVIMTRLCRVDGGHPVSRPGFAEDMRGSSHELQRLAEELVGDVRELCQELELLAQRAAAGEDLTRYDVELPWERRQRPR